MGWWWREGGGEVKSTCQCSLSPRKAPRDQDQYSQCKDDREGPQEEEEEGGGGGDEVVVVVVRGAAGGEGAGLGVEVVSTSGAEAAEIRRTLLTRSVS